MISMIVAVDKNMGIGKNNQLLAHIKPDLKYFKHITNGHTIVMGYNTFLSLPIKPLPNRINIILSDQPVNYNNVIVVSNINDLLKLLNEKKDEEIFICGGASVYRQLMPYANKLYITHIDHYFDADTFFPDIDKSWQLISETQNEENLNHNYPHKFCIYERKSDK